MVYPTKDKAIKDIASWIELRYNHVRLHSALGYRIRTKRTRTPELNEGSLKHQTSTVRKHQQSKHPTSMRGPEVRPVGNAAKTRHGLGRQSKAMQTHHLQQVRSHEGPPDQQ